MAVIGLFIHQMQRLIYMNTRSVHHWQKILNAYSKSQQFSSSESRMYRRCRERSRRPGVRGCCCLTTWQTTWRRWWRHRRRWRHRQWRRHSYRAPGSRPRWRSGWRCRDSRRTGSGGTGGAQARSTRRRGSRRTDPSPAPANTRDYLPYLLHSARRTLHVCRWLVNRGVMHLTSSQTADEKPPTGLWLAKPKHFTTEANRLAVSCRLWVTFRVSAAEHAEHDRPCMSSSNVP